MVRLRFPGQQEHGFYRRPIANPQNPTTKKGGWRIEICKNECSTSTDWSPYNFRRLATPGVENGLAKWLLTCEENGMLQTGTSGEARNWNAPPMQLVTQYLGILEGKGCDIQSASSMFCGEGTGPIWMWTLTF